MAEQLEAGAADGAEYYMVTVLESVTFSYPVLATDAEAAREKVAALIEAGRVRAPESTPIPLTPFTPPSGGLRLWASWPLRTRRG